MVTASDDLHNKREEFLKRLTGMEDYAVLQLLEFETHEELLALKKIVEGWRTHGVKSKLELLLEDVLKEC